MQQHTPDTAARGPGLNGVHSDVRRRLDADTHAGSSSIPLVDSGEAMAATGVGCFVWMPETGHFALDSCGLAVFDLKPEEYDGMATSLGLRIPAEEVDRLMLLVADVKAGRRDAYSSYFRIRRRDGGSRWAHTQGRLIRDADGVAVKVVGVVRDATEELSYSAGRLVAEDELRRREDATQEIAQALADALSVQDVVAVLTGAHSLRRLRAQGISLGVMDQGRLRIIGVAGPSRTGVHVLEQPRLKEPWPLNDAARTGEPQFFTSRERFLYQYPKMAAFLKGSAVTAGAFLPLTAHSRTIGAMGLLYEGRRAFSIDDRTLLTALGSAIAQSLQRAMLVDQAREIAAGLQNAMLPRRLPKPAGGQIATRYRTARAGTLIGGDWYDAVMLPGGRLAVTIGDVQGHDTEAAAIMGQLRIAMSAYTSESHPVETVLNQASTFLRELPVDRFATCFYAQIALASGEVTAANAGHLCPLVRHQDGTVVRHDVPAGPPLGLPLTVHEHAYQPTAFALAPGDTLLLCSDGLVERPGEDLDRGIDRLFTALATGPEDLEALADHLMADLAERLDSEDDTALLLLRRAAHEMPRADG